MAKPMDAAVIEIMQNYNPRDYLDGADLVEWDKIASLMYAITVKIGEGGKATYPADSDYDRAAQYLDLPLMSGLPPESKYKGDSRYEPRAKLRGDITYGLFERFALLKTTAGELFATRYKAYPREAMNVAAAIETEIIVDVREKAADIITQIYELEQALQEAQGLIKGSQAAHKNRMAKIQDRIADARKTNEYVFGDDALLETIAEQTEYLTLLLTLAGETWVKRLQEKRQKRIADKWTIKAPSAEPSYRAPGTSPITIQSTAQTSEYVFDKSPNNTELIATGATTYKAVFKKANNKNQKFDCTIQMAPDKSDDLYDPQLDCLRPEYRPVYHAIESICHQITETEHRPINEAPISLGSILRKMQGSAKRRTGDDDSISKQIRRAVDRMMRQFITIDCTEEARAYEFDGSEFAIQEPILDGRIIITTVNGKRTRTLLLDRLPGLYRYARKCKKYITYDERYTRGGPKHLSLGTLALRDYIARRIFWAYRSGKSELRILLDGIAECLGIDPKGQGKMKHLRTKTEEFLTDWQKPDAEDESRFRLIKGFTQYKARRKILGFDISLLERNIESFQLPPEPCQALHLT